MDSASREVIALPLTEKVGNAAFYLGMPLKLLRQAVSGLCFGRDYKAEGGFFAYYLLLWNAIKVRVNINVDTSESVVDQIGFFGRYSGTFDGIGIGSTVENLLNARKDIYFDEEYILVGNSYPYNFILSIDNDHNTIHSLNEILSKQITHITVEDLRLRS